MNIAIVDDMPDDLAAVANAIRQYEKENNVSFDLQEYLSSVEFLEKYKGQYDIIFLDVEMPGSTGLECAREIREKDETAALVFITSVARYAIDGYKYQALDFMVKPVEYGPFSYKLQKALDYAKARRAATIEITSQGETVHVPVNEITYCDKDGNNVLIHLVNGETIAMRGTIRVIEEKLKSNAFAELSAGSIVNMNHVDQITKDTVIIGAESIPLSRRYRKDFLNAFMEFVR